MGLFSKIGHALKGAVKGIAKFASSPIGKVLIGVGLGVLTGGVSSLFTGGLSSIAGGLGNIGNVVKGLASSFFSNPMSMLSQGNLGSVGNILQSVVGSGGGTSGVSDVFQTLMGAMSGNQNTQDPVPQQASTENMQQMAAYYQAQAMQQQLQQQSLAY
jgi:hypothetical protein